MSSRAVSVDLDRPRRLLYGTANLARAEKELGMGLGAMLSARNMGPRVIGALLWAGLLWETPRLTLAGAYELMDQHLQNGGSFDSLSEVITEGLVAAKVLRLESPAADGSPEGNASPPAMAETALAGS